MKIGIDFTDINSYIDSMSKGLDDKLFFLNKINFKKDGSYLFVDFGCADGVLLSTLYEILSAKGVHAYYIGYDISEEMINLAKSKFNAVATNVIFTNSWDEVKEIVEKYSAMESVLILSSVLHEVYSYGTTDDISTFWRRVTSGIFKYICIRDMMCTKDIERPTDVTTLQVFKEYLGFASTKSKLCREFEERWGSITSSMKNFVHFLLKYRWQINWVRELNENYFPFYVENILSIFGSANYNINYMERFRVPFLDDCFKKDFGVELEDYTHAKIIFERSK